MNSEELAQYMALTDKNHQPWLLVQLRLKKLEENRHLLSSEEYLETLTNIHQDFMNLGNDWWVGREAELFGME